MKLSELISRLDVTETTVATDLLDQASLLMKASQYRVRKMRTKLRLEAKLGVVQSRVSMAVREQATDERKTEAYIKEKVARHKAVREAQALLLEAKCLEEAAKALVDAYQSRGSMLKALVQLIGSDAALHSGVIKEALDRLGVDRLRHDVQKKFRGG